MSDRPFTNSALDNSALDNSALANSTSGISALDNPALDNPALDNSTLDNFALDTPALGDLATSGDLRASEPSDAEIVTVHPDESVMTRQRLPYFLGISNATAGTVGLSMNLVIIPPGASAEPHFHKTYETAIFLLKGRVETRYGIGLKKSVIHEAGDFIFIPPGVPHQPFNLSDTEPAQAIVARNDPNEQENVVPYHAEPGA